LETAKRDLERRGAEVLTVVCDVGDPDQVERLMRQTLTRYGRVDILVNNVGGSRNARIWEMAADDWVARASRLFPGLDASQHCLFNPSASIGPDGATCETYVRAEHALDGGLYTIGGHYTHRLQRDADGWRINHVTLRVAWTQGDAELLDRARQRVR